MGSFPLGPRACVTQPGWCHCSPPCVTAAPGCAVALGCWGDLSSAEMTGLCIPVQDRPWGQGQGALVLCMGRALHQESLLSHPEPGLLFGCPVWVSAAA